MTGAGRAGGRPWRAAPARLGRTVGSPSYGCSVITPATSAEPAPCGRCPLDEIDFVIVDVETTGWTPGVARITEIGAVKISAGHQLGQFSSLVNPGRAIPERVAALGVDAFFPKPFSPAQVRRTLEQLLNDTKH